MILLTYSWTSRTVNAELAWQAFNTVNASVSRYFLSSSSPSLFCLYFSPKLHLSTPALRRFGSPSAAATALSVAAESTTPRAKPPTRTSSTDSETSTPSIEVVNSLTSRRRQSLTGTLNRREPSFRTRVQQIIGASE